MLCSSCVPVLQALYCYLLVSSVWLLPLVPGIFCGQFLLARNAIQPLLIALVVSLPISAVWDTRTFGAMHIQSQQHEQRLVSSSVAYLHSRPREGMQSSSAAAGNNHDFSVYKHMP